MAIDRCKFFAQLTKSNDDSCTLFEDILDDFFEEYSFLYGAIRDGGFVDSIDIESAKNGDDIEVTVIMNKKIVSDFFVDKVEEFLSEKIPDNRRVQVIKQDSDTALIIFRRD